MDQRGSVLNQVADEIRDRAAHAIIFVAIDGVDGAGKTRFADDLAHCFASPSVIRASVDSFHNPREVRYFRGKDSPDGFFRDSYNYAELKRLLLDPLKGDPATPFCPAHFDHRTDQDVAPHFMAPPTTGFLIFDGIFLHRPELKDYWDYSIFLDVSTRESVRRCNDREGATGVSYEPDDPVHRRYVEGQDIYLRTCTPQTVCTRLICHESFDAPVLVP